MTGRHGIPGRMMPLPAVVVVALSLICISLSRADVMDRVADRYAREEGVAGRFEQHLISPGGQEHVYRGRYSYSRDEGLRWSLEAPDRGTLVIDSDGDATVTGELGGLSVFHRRTVGRLIVAMVSMDESVLQRYYTISQDNGPTGFRVTLEARNRWRRVAGRVTIQGSDLVDAVRMEMPDGRIMILSLTHDG